jgi:hypothetical protein
MMIATRNSSTDEKRARAGAQSSITATDSKQGKLRISATERWRLISKKAYSRAQRRGFVGGDPFEDVAEAIKEIDDEYVTDIGALLSLSDRAELLKQFRNLFAGFGLDKRSLDELLAMNLEALERLAESNSALVNGAAERAVRRSALLRNASQEAMHALRSMARTAARIKGRAHIPGQPTAAAFENVLSRLGALTNSLGEILENGNGRSALNEQPPILHERMEIHGGLVKAYEGKTPAELAEAPVAALKGISQATGERFRSAFGMACLRDMANNDLFRQADGIVTLAAAERSSGQGDDSPGRRGALADLASGSVRQLEGIASHQVVILRDALGVETVRDLAENKFFRLARAIALLADVESH